LIHFDLALHLRIYRGGFASVSTPRMPTSRSQKVSSLASSSLNHFILFSKLSNYGWKFPSIRVRSASSSITAMLIAMIIEDTTIYCCISRVVDMMFIKEIRPHDWDSCPLSDMQYWFKHFLSFLN
jgi:hypothetical protein